MQSSRSCLSSPSHKTWMANLWNISYWGICKKPLYRDACGRLTTTEIYLNFSPEDVVREFWEKW
jgi:hypothetical protein